MNDVAWHVSAAIEEKHHLELGHPAFGWLVRRFQDMAYGYACALLSDPTAAADVAQESLITAWRKLDQLSDPSAFPGWFRTIVRRTAFRELKRMRRRPVPEDENAESTSRDGQVLRPAPGAGFYPVVRPDSMLPASKTPEYEALRSESIEEVRAAMARLPESLRTAVVLYYVDGYEIVEVAEFLGIGAAAVKKRLQRGRDAMRDELEEKIKGSVRERLPSRDGRVLEAVDLYTSFAVAAQLGQISLLEAMLVDGIDVNERDARGRTLLHWAVETRHYEAVELLLKNGADQHLRDREGVSPRHLAQAEPSFGGIQEMLNGYK